jgi:hypothetical protein
MLRTTLRAEARDGSLSGEFVATPLTNFLDFNVATHIIRVDFTIFCIVAYHGVP